MYKIIGGDQKEYGPVTADQLREWIQMGRADAQTRVQMEGQTDWRALGELPEFADALPLRPAAPPSLTPEVKPKTSGLAIASLVLAGLSILNCGITGLVGLVLGIVALAKIKNSQGLLAGRGLAIAGVALSALSLVMLVLLILFSLPFFAGLSLPALFEAKAKAQNIQCMNHVKQLNLAAIMYANDQKGRLPDADRWCELVQTYLGGGANQVFLCPAGNQSDRCHYAFNAKLSGVELNYVKNPAQTVLFVEAGSGWNRSASSALWTATRRRSHLPG
jgi:hypothetical protein